MLNEKQVINYKDLFNNKGYCQIDNIFHPQLLEYLKIGSSMLEYQTVPEKNNERDVVRTNKQNSIHKYGPDIGENLLVFLTPLFNQITGKNLIPTYSYFRKYFQTNTLLKHQDRPSCQYSATIQFNSSKNESWPIWVQDKNKENIKCSPKVGDIIFYMGEKLPHWREELKYEHSSHLFLHWVDKEDPNYKNHWWDFEAKTHVESVGASQ
tara:strand:- start:63 stop:689 length:627 start_codon:yes stop_codon:yes gene_type:complete